MRTTCIYRITCIANGKHYVGQTVHWKERKSTHLRKLRSGIHENRHLQRAWNTYGESSFEIAIIEQCNVEMLDQREIHWINELKAQAQGFNFLKGGKEGTRGIRNTDESNRKRSETMKKKYADPEHQTKMRAIYDDPEHRKKIGQTTKERYSDAEYKAKFSEAMQQENCRTKISKSLKGKPKPESYKATLRGRKLSEETRLKISIAGKQRRHSEETRKKIAKSLRERKANEENSS